MTEIFILSGIALLLAMIVVFVTRKPKSSGFPGLHKSVEPQIDERWRFNDGSPWGDGSIAKVIDVKDGWVRYNLSPIFPDNRLKMNEFLRMYELIDEGEKL